MLPSFLVNCIVYSLCLSQTVVNVGASSQSRKNILLLLTDDQDVVLGGADHMPNVDRYIAQQGTTFANAFVHTPICCPSRSTMLSGRYLHNGGAQNNSISGNCDGKEWKESIEPYYTYAVEAQKAGYTTAYAGKYLNQYGILPTGHHDPNPRVPAGWDHWFGLVGNSRYYNYSVVASNSNGTNTQIQAFGDRRDEDYLPHVLQNHTLQLLLTLPEPWLMVVAWPSPHAPFTPAAWALDHFQELTAPLTPNFNATDSSMQQKHWLLRQLPPITETEKSNSIDVAYHRRLETLLTVDDHVGRLHTLLASLGQWERTVALFTSDNGFQFGQHRLAIDKRHLYENDIRVPLIIKGLDQDPNEKMNTSSGRWTRNATVTDLVVNVDLAPTIFDIVNNHDERNRQTATTLPLPSYMDGLSLLRPTRREHFLVTYNGEADPRCGLADCPIPSPGHMWYMPDSFNNTYHCIRTLRQQQGENSIFCQFADTENFVEFYNLETNPHQLNNDFPSLLPDELKAYKKRLSVLLSCQGETCRSSSSSSTGGSNAGSINPAVITTETLQRTS